MNNDSPVWDPINREMARNYFRSLVNRFFKILPIWEGGDGSVSLYMDALRSELLGCESIVLAIRNDGEYLSLISILQDLIDHPEYEHDKVRRSVFSSISICNKLIARYFAEVSSDGSVETV